MGLSLPLLVRARVADSSTAPRTIAFLYGVNVLGAAAGALLAPWVLVRHLGMAGACAAAALANLAAAAGALLAGPARPPEGRDAGGAAGPAAPWAAVAPPATISARFPQWLLLYALSGFIALSFEIVWFRLIDVGVKSTAFTFGTVLCVYLVGLGAGSLAGSRLARPARAPPRGVPRRAARDPRDRGRGAWPSSRRCRPRAPVYSWFFEYWRQDPFFQLGADWNAGALARLYALYPLALYGVPTVLMGLSFGALQRAVQDDPATSGRKVGFLQAANIAGCTAGSLLTGLVLLERVGTAGTVRLLVAAGALVFLAVRARAAGLTRGLALRGLVLVVVLVALPGQATLWERLHGVPADEGRPTFVGEDASAVSAVVPGARRELARGRERPAPQLAAVRGHPHAPRRGARARPPCAPAHRRRRPGLGRDGVGGRVPAGDGDGPRLRDRRLAAPPPARGERRGALRVARASCSPDPRVTIEAADGRQALARSGEPYDVVQVDAMFLTSAGSGNLYSVEFFRLCARRLAPGGIVCTQKPSRRVGLTFAEALPHAVDFDNIVIGSNDPLPIDPVAWRARLDRPDVAAASRRRRSSRSASGSGRAARRVATPTRGWASTATSSRATSSRPARR